MQTNLNQKLLAGKNNGLSKPTLENVSQRSEAAASNLQQPPGDGPLPSSGAQVSKPMPKPAQTLPAHKVPSTLNLLQIQNQAQSQQHQFLQNLAQEPISGAGLTAA